MVYRTLQAAVAILALASPAVAQDNGGVRLAPGVKGGPVGLARPLPFTFPPMLSAHDAQNGMTPADHQAQNQNMISRLRGDAGFLAGFSMGTPLAASRQVPTGFDDGGYGGSGDYPSSGYRHRHGQRPIIINNEGPLAVTVGNGNVVQQQSANGAGPIAQQQVATTPSGGSQVSGGALNLVTGSGNIIQRSPGGH